MENGADRGEESNPDYAAALTIVVASADPIVGAGLRAILQPTGARLESVVSFSQAVDLILGSSSPGNPLLDPLLVLLYFPPSTRPNDMVTAVTAATFDPLLLEQLQRRTPSVPVLAIGQGEMPPPLPGLSVFWGTGSPDRLRDAVTQIAQGQGVWWLDGTVSLPTFGTALAPFGALESGAETLEISPSHGPAADLPPGDWLKQWFHRAFQRGNALVQDELQQIEKTLRSTPQTWLDRQILQGQQRELQLVQWLLTQGLVMQDWPGADSAVPIQALPPEGSPVPRLSSPPSDRSSDSGDSRSNDGDFATADLALEPLPPHLEDLLFDRFLAKLASPLRNLTPLPLEIEGLNLHKRRELLVLVVQCLGDRLTELRHSGISPEQLSQQPQQILEDLWQETITRFFGQYTIVILAGQSVPLVPRLLSYRESVRSFILRSIPLWPTVIHTLLFQESVLVDGSPYRYDSPEALHRLEQLFENLVLQVANAVVQPLLNECSKVELIKQTYFHPRLLSTRQIERFRNDLSWKYRVLQSFEEPRNIYESRFALLVIQPDGIHRLGIYSPRQGELEGLNLWQQSVTLSLEFRDAVAPRLQSLTRWLGQGVVYLLTQVLGKAIGLIGRGIVQGLGSVWSDGTRR